MPFRLPHRRTALGCAAALLLLLLTGCGATDSADDGPQVVAAFYPLAWATEQVAGDELAVTNLTSPGGEPHDLGLGIDQSAALARADLVVLLDGFQPAVDAAVESVAEDALVVDAADVVELRPAVGGGHEHAEDHGDGEAHGEGDPHFWLDPLLMADLGDAVAEALADVHPESAETFAGNAADLRTQLERLDAEYAEGLADCRRDTVVVSHAAFGYLERYGVHFEPIAGLSPGAEATPADLAHLQQVIRDEELTTVFSERLSSDAMARSLARDLGVATDVLDPIEGLTGEDDDADYVSLMTENLAALTKANGC